VLDRAPDQAGKDFWMGSQTSYPDLIKAVSAANETSTKKPFGMARGGRIDYSTSTGGDGFTGDGRSGEGGNDGQGSGFTGGGGFDGYAGDGRSGEGGNDGYGDGSTRRRRTHFEQGGGTADGPTVNDLTVNALPRDTGSGGVGAGGTGGAGSYDIRYGGPGDGSAGYGYNNTGTYLPAGRPPAAPSARGRSTRPRP
jgi:hypothetical protein